MINEAIYKESDDKLYQRWIIGRYERTMTFDEFKRKSKAPKKIDANKPIPKKIKAKDALKKVENILKLNWRSEK